MRTNVAYLFDRMPAESWPFQRFWLDYPRKMDKAAATRAWAGPRRVATRWER